MPDSVEFFEQTYQKEGTIKIGSEKDNKITKEK